LGWGGGRINPPGPRRPKKPGLNRVNIHVNIHIKPNSKMKQTLGQYNPVLNDRVLNALPSVNYVMSNYGMAKSNSLDKQYLGN